MAQQIIDTGANANDGTGEPLRQAFTAVNENFTEIYTAGPVGSDIKIVGNVISTTQPNQNLTLQPNGIGVVQANTSVNPSINLVYDLGSPTLKWDSVYAGYLFGNGAFLTGINASGAASNSFSTVSANGVNLVANTATGILTLTPGNNIVITGSSSANSVVFGVSSSPSFAGNVTGGNIFTAGVISAAGNITSGNLNTGNITAGNLSFTGRVIGNLYTTGNITAGNVISTERIIASSDIVSYGNLSGTYLFGNGAFLTGITGTGNYSNANVAAYLPTYSGNVSAAYFIGNGSQLTSITGANVTGTVARATQANTANTALSVAGANVTGAVALANNASYANLAYTAWGNGIIGSVATANTANVAYSVAGANVTGTVANATYATSAGSATTASSANTAIQANTANIALSVAGANVTGTVAQATNASYANLAYTAWGNGVIGSVSSANTANVALSVAGANVQGTVANATYAVTAGSAVTAVSANTAVFANVANVAYSVAGANVTGMVSAANTALYANFAYTAWGNGVVGTVSSANTANVANTANIANIAYSVAGANVTGTVANATYATSAGSANTANRASIANVAYSVAGANVTGTVAFAIDASYANLAYTAWGNGIIGSVSSANTANTANTANVALLVAGANVTGTVANATYAVSAGSAATANTANTANVALLVAGANVQGPVATANNASYANLAYTAWANGVIGTVATANTANVAYSVAGANVTGTVANATYATSAGSAATAGSANTANRANTANVAYSVAGANVTGYVAWATNASYANLAYDAWVAQTVSYANQPNITSVGTLTSLTASGNITSGTNFIGNGALLTGIVASNVGVLSTLSVTGNAQIGNVRTAGIVTAAGNIVSAANVRGNYFIGNGAFITGIVATAGSAIENGQSNVRIGGANANVTVSVNTVSNVAVFTTSGLDVVGNISAAGNVTGNYILGNGALLTGVITSVANINSGTSNITVVSPGGNITVGVGGVGNVVVFANTGAYIAGQVSASGNITANYFVGNGSALTGVTAAGVNAAALTGNTLSSNVLYSSLTQVGNLANLSVVGDTVSGNLYTAGIVSASGNITANYFIGNGSQLTGIDATIIQNGNSNVKVYANGNVSTSINGISNVITVSDSGQYVSGLVSVLGNVTAGNISTANLLSTNNFSITGNITGNLIPSANVTYNIGNPTHAFKDLYLSGNSIYLGAQIISSNATGISVGTGDLAGNNITAANAVAAGTTVSAAGNITGGNVLTAGVISATANVTGGNVLTAGTVSATANVTGGNLLTAGLISAASTITSSANITGANLITSGLATVSGNVIGGNLLTGGLISAVGNITGGNASITGGTLAFANASIVQTNPLDLAITSAYQISLKPASGTYQWTFGNDGALTGPTGVGVTGYLSAGGNVTGGNILTAGVISTTGNVIAGNVNTNAIRPVTGGLTISTASGNLTLQPSGNVVLSNTIINSVAYPQQDQDAASKIYVDNMVSTGLAYHSPVAAATTANLATVTGGSITYTQPNGVANGIGAKLTTTGTFNLIDTANIQTVGTRILVKDEVNAVYNGVYTWANATNIVRSTDTDTYGPDSTTDLSLNDYFFVQSGNINKGSAYVVSAPAGTITFGTSNIVFSQFSSSQTYTANTDAGISLAGTQINAKVDQTTTAFDGSGNIIVKAGANLTTPNIGAATGTSLSVSGNIRVGNIVIPSSGNINVGNVNIANLAAPASPSDAATKAYVDSQAGNVSGNVIGNLIALGTPADGSLTVNVAYPGWTTATFVTDGLDDLNQVALNIAKNTFVGQANLSGTPLAGSSPITVAFTGTYIGNVNSYLWDFGDGTTSTSANPSHTYSNVSGGQFTVSYTAYNSNGTYSGNAALGAKGSVSSTTRSNYITLYTPTPVSGFTVANSSIDTSSNAQISNASQYANYFELNWGDGTANVNFNNGWTTKSHTYTNSANTDSRYGIVLTATSNTAGPANVSTVSSTSYVKVYSPQSPAFTANTLNVINYAATSGGVVSFRNDTPGSPGTTAIYGAQQLYNWQWGDGTANSNVNIQSGLAGNPGAANITHTFALSAAQQTAGTTVSYTANLWLYTGYSTSPFRASNVTITVEPEVRANFLGTANTQSDASGASAQTGYIYTDYNGNNRAVFSFQNSSQLANLYNWSFGDSTYSNGVANLSNVNHTYTATGSYTVALTANGTPGTTAQSNTQTRTSYITIAANPTAPGALSTKTISMSTASEGTSPLLAASATDNSGGNIPAAGSSVTRYISATPIVSTTASGANTSTSGTLTAYVNNTAAGNTPFTVGTSNTGTFTNLVVSQDADAHTVISATYPTGFYKVFSASVSKSLASLSTGYSDYKLAHSTTGNTNATGFVKDNLSAVPTLSNASVTMTETTAGTYRYISGVPYYNTGSPVISINSLAVSNLTGQTYRSTTTPVTVLSGTNYESTSGAVIGTQTKTYAQIDGASSMLTGGIPNANVGIASAYTLGNLAISVNGSAQAVATLNTNIINVNGTSTTISLPTKIQVYSTALSGFDESNIAVASGLGSVYTDNATRISGLGSGNTPAFSNSTNFYTANAWSGAVTMTGTSEAVVRWGTLQHFNSANFSTGYLPVGPDLVTGRSGIQYFTFAFRRSTMASFDVILTTTTGIAGLWVAAPGTTIDKSGFSSPTPGYPGPTSTLNGWLTGFQQYNGAGVPGASATGGNPAGTNGCALTGADVIPLNTPISNQRYTMTLGSQNSSNSTGNNILIRIGLSSGQTLTSVAIGLAT